MGEGGIAPDQPQRIHRTHQDSNGLTACGFSTGGLRRVWHIGRVWQGVTCKRCLKLKGKRHG